jgi:hypothetical protein
VKFPISREQMLGICAVLATFWVIQYFTADQPILILSATDTVTPH